MHNKHILEMWVLILNILTWQQCQVKEFFPSNYSNPKMDEPYFLDETDRKVKWTPIEVQLIL